MSVNQIHPTAVIGPRVEIGSDNVIGPGAVILGPCQIGDRNWIGPQAVIGVTAQDRSVTPVRPWDEASRDALVMIGDDNVIREHASIQQPLGRLTTIGSRCMIMSTSVISHDCQLGDDVTVASGTVVGGHCLIGDGANLGLGCRIHQHRRIGPYAMIGMGVAVARDVPPGVVFAAPAARVAGWNLVGLRRAGMDTTALTSDNATRSLAAANLPASVQDSLERWLRTIDTDTVDR